MATYTSYLNLEKPAVGETFNLLKINQNWDKIDQGVSSLNSNLKIRYTDVVYTNLTMNSSGYIANSNKPTAPTGTVLICALVLSGTFNKASDIPVMQANGDYFYGEPDKTYNRLTVRYVYAQALEIS